MYVNINSQSVGVAVDILAELTSEGSGFEAASRQTEALNSVFKRVANDPQLLGSLLFVFRHWFIGSLDLLTSQTGESLEEARGRIFELLRQLLRDAPEAQILDLP